MVIKSILLKNLHCGDKMIIFALILNKKMILHV